MGPPNPFRALPTPREGLDRVHCIWQLLFPDPNLVKAPEPKACADSGADWASWLEDCLRRDRSGNSLRALLLFMLHQERNRALEAFLRRQNQSTG